MSLPGYARYKDSGVEWLGEIPEHWSVSRLKRNVRLLTGKSVRRDHPVALENIESWTGRFIPTETEFEGEGVAFDAGDILFGKLRPYLAKVFIAVSSGEAVGDFHVLRAVNGIDARFARYLMLNREFISIVDGSTFGSKMPRSSWDVVGAVWVTVPPRREQGTIASFLDRETAKIDILIAEQKQLIELLREKRQAVVSHAVIKGLDSGAPMKPSGIEWLGDVPEHWELKRLKYLGDAIIGLTYDPSDVVDEGEGTLVLRSSNVQNEQIVFDDNVYVATSIPEKLITRIGDILICSRNGSRALIGKNATIDQRSAGLTFGAFMTVFRSKHSEYLSYVLKSQLFEFQSSAFLTATINQLTVSSLNSFEVPMPPDTEQRSIAKFLKAETVQLRALTAQSQTVIELLQERRSALISAAVTGKIDVRGLVASEAA